MNLIIKLKNRPQINLFQHGVINTTVTTGYFAIWSNTLSLYLFSDPPGFLSAPPLLSAAMKL